MAHGPRVGHPCERSARSGLLFVEPGLLADGGPEIEEAHPMELNFRRPEMFPGWNVLSL